VDPVLRGASWSRLERGEKKKPLLGFYGGSWAWRTQPAGRGMCAQKADCLRICAAGPILLTGPEGIGTGVVTPERDSEAANSAGSTLVGGTDDEWDPQDALRLCNACFNRCSGQPCCLHHRSRELIRQLPLASMSRLWARAAREHDLQAQEALAWANATAGGPGHPGIVKGLNHKSWRPRGACAVLGASVPRRPTLANSSSCGSGTGVA